MDNGSDRVVVIGDSTILESLNRQDIEGSSKTRKLIVHNLIKNSKKMYKKLIKLLLKTRKHRTPKGSFGDI